MRKMLPSGSEDESGKHAYSSRGSENKICMDAKFPRASTGAQHAGDKLAIARAQLWRV
jgi:hypothetical protein